MATKCEGYIERSIEVHLDLMLATNCELTYSLDIDDDNVLKSAMFAVGWSGSMFKEMMSHIEMPAAPLSGDEPLVTATITYRELKLGGLPALRFSTEEVLPVKSTKSGEAVDLTLRAALDYFTARIGFLSTIEE